MNAYDEETSAPYDRSAVPEAKELLTRQRFDYLLGPLKEFLDDSRVTNLHVNQGGEIAVERFGQGKFKADARMREDARRALLAYLANKENTVIDAQKSSLSAEMPYYGSRVRGFAPPISRWSIVIRQHTPTIPLTEYIARGLLTDQRAAVIRTAIAEEKNIVVAGKMNSGKTALVRSLLDVAAELRPHHRPVIVQNNNELQAEKFWDKITLLARVPQATAGINSTVSHYTYEFTDALEDALQCNGNFLIWGELRDGKSAVGLTMAMNTGTRGFMTTIHADSAEETLHRIEDLISIEGKPVVRRMLAKFVNVIVFMNHEDTTGKRWVSDLVEVQGLDGKGDYVFAKR